MRMSSSSKSSAFVVTELRILALLNLVLGLGVRIHGLGETWLTVNFDSWVGPVCKRANRFQDTSLESALLNFYFLISLLHWVKWQSQEVLLLKKTWYEKPQREGVNYLPSSHPTPPPASKCKQAFFFPFSLSDKFESTTWSGAHYVESAYFLLMFDRN